MEDLKQESRYCLPLVVEEAAAVREAHCCPALGAEEGAEAHCYQASEVEVAAEPAQWREERKPKATALMELASLHRTRQGYLVQTTASEAPSFQREWKPTALHCRFAVDRRLQLRLPNSPRQTNHRHLPMAFSVICWELPPDQEELAVSQCPAARVDGRDSCLSFRALGS